ncbi:hypothetical protein VTK26DRAFT_797 [Humicola hyalothermophila]
MDHLPRFHRRKKDVVAPTLITTDLPRPGKTTPPPGDLHPASPLRPGPFQKLSPFRVFHRSSGKRARDSPPASLPHSPAAAPMFARDCTDARPVSPLSLKADSDGDENQKDAKPLQIPAFLNQSEQDIENKFTELVWRERDRVLQSINNPSPDFRWARVTGPHLRLLDRYMNIQPWHNNRVKLQVPEGHVDYINASPIVLEPTTHPGASAPGEPARYIAMQGPKQSSVDHVWRMVVEQLGNPGVIVMLTETHEGHLEKCYPYFPRSKDDPPIEVNERDEFGDGFRATVRCEGMEDTPAGDAIELRKLVIRVHSRPKPGTTVCPASAAEAAAASAKPIETEERDPDSDIKMKSPAPDQPAVPAADSNPTTEPPATSTPTFPTSVAPNSAEQDPSSSTASEPEERIVWHFLFKKWPDFGVPSLADLDSFFTLMRLSREKNCSYSSSSSSPSPRIVHCSAGVGRSGTFIALEYLMGELERGVLEHWDDHHPRGDDDDQVSGNAGSGSANADMEGAERGGSDGGGGGGTPGSASAASSALGLDRGLIGLGEDLIFETVNRLREQRRTMVQADSQYLFLYQVLRKLWLERYGSRVAGGEGAQKGRHAGSGGGGSGSDGDGDDSGGSTTGEPAAKRLEVDPDPFVG